MSSTEGTSGKFLIDEFGIQQDGEVQDSNELLNQPVLESSGLRIKDLELSIGELTIEIDQLRAELISPLERERSMLQIELAKARQEQEVELFEHFPGLKSIYHRRGRGRNV